MTHTHNEIGTHLFIRAQTIEHDVLVIGQHLGQLRLAGGRNGTRRDSGGVGDVSRRLRCKETDSDLRHHKKNRQQQST